MEDMERPFWGIRIQDLAHVAPMDAMLRQATGIDHPVLHPVGGEWFAITPSAEAWIDEHWDEDWLRTKADQVERRVLVKYFVSPRVLPEQATLDPADAVPVTAEFHDWGDRSETPDGDGVSWPLRMCRFPEAWAAADWFTARSVAALAPIGHLDTGITDHPAFGTLARADGDTGWVRVHRGGSTLGDGQGPFDPLVGGGQPGHGARIGSAIYGDLPGRFRGGAPGCPAIPFRVAATVIILSGMGADPDDVALGIRAAVEAGCANINISMGGPESAALEAAVRDAYLRGVIVCAAGANVIETVQNPAALPATIALAAIERDGRPWSLGARGPAIDLAAPGAGIWRGDTFLQNGRRLHTFANSGSGTSYATAFTSAACALWRARHGPALDRYRGWERVEAFRHCLTEGADRPAENAFLRAELGAAGAAARSWNPKLYGAGILNAERLLDAPLPPPEALRPRITVPGDMLRPEQSG